MEECFIKTGLLSIFSKIFDNIMTVKLVDLQERQMFKYQLRYRGALNSEDAQDIFMNEVITTMNVVPVFWIS